MPGSGGESQATKTVDPWSGSQPYLKDIMAQSSNLYNAGAGSQLWGGPNVAPLNPLTAGSIGMTVGNALNSNTSQPFDYLSGVVGNGGLSAGSGGALGSLNNVATGQNAIGTGANYLGLANAAQTQNVGANGVLGGIASGAIGIDPSGFSALANSAAGPTASALNLGTMASGADAGRNPYITQMLDQGAARIGNRVASSMSAMGRYGSAGMGDALAKSISEFQNPVLANAYETDRNRMLQASGQIDSSQRAADAIRLGALNGGVGVQATNIGNQRGAAGELGVSNRADLASSMAALGGATGVQGQNIGNQLGASTGLLGALQGAQTQGMQAASALPSAYQFQYAPAQALGSAGDYLQGRSQAGLDAQKALFNQAVQMPWTQLARYAGGVTGLAPLLQGTGTTNASQSNTSSWGDLLKFGSNVAGFALPSLSDRNEKTDIKKVGVDPATGLTQYAYRYKGDPKSYPKVVGPMAQEIERKYPGSTGLIDGKLYVKPHAVGLLGNLEAA